MKILYYIWDETNVEDAMECLKYSGHEVEQFSFPISDKLNDVLFAKELEKILKEKSFDCIFTFNFFPIISKVAYAYEIKYISWVFDTPHFTMYTNAVFNECNYIFCFDRTDVIKFKSYGVKNIYHMPLATNTTRLKKILTGEEKMLYDISFLGNLYNDEYNFFDQIKNMPDYYKGFFDGLVETQMQIYGCDVASLAITNKKFEEIKKFVPIQLDEEMFIEEKDVFINFLHKKMTIKERPEILHKISQKYQVTLFASKPDPTLTQVDFQGYANYRTKMPFVFANSKINLNITVRGNLSGIPLRCIDVMGAGGFLLSNYQPELDEYFVNGQEMVMYESRDDLLDKIEYYLTHEKERKEIALCGQAKVQKEFSYEKKFKEIFDIVYGE